MKVVFCDVRQQLALGNATQASLPELLAVSDVVTLHVPNNPQTLGMIGASEIAAMKRGAYLINNARGELVKTEALVAALKSGQLGGCAIDVFPAEPSESLVERGSFYTPLAGMPNTILTPHIGGSTEEAQESIAEETTSKLIKLLSNGSTLTAQNMPEVEVGPVLGEIHRMLHLHTNSFGTISGINQAIESLGVNVIGQVLKTNEDYGYVVLDVERRKAYELKRALEAVPNTIWVRSLLRSSGKWGSETDLKDWADGPAERHQLLDWAEMSVH